MTRTQLEASHHMITEGIVATVNQASMAESLKQKDVPQKT